jgi:hypothetical protein
LSNYNQRITAEVGDIYRKITVRISQQNTVVCNVHGLYQETEKETICMQTGHIVDVLFVEFILTIG